MTNCPSSLETNVAADNKEENLGVHTMYNVTNRLLEKAIDKLAQTAEEAAGLDYELGRLRSQNTTTGDIE